MKPPYTPIIGLEIHVELSTKSKMFCQCSADYFGKDPNTNICPVCLGMPGALPVPNRQALDWVIKIGQALGCTIREYSKFDRKHYFYPDLPKGYQISQYDEPFCEDGNVALSFSPDKKGGEPVRKSFRIRRVHMEEDTGKLIHKAGDSLVNFNRSGVPLVEIVTEPDFHSAEDVKRFLEELQIIIRYLGVSDADMEKGSMRLEPNISVQKTENLHDLPPYKVEVKNINSFSFVKKAIEYEVKRHTQMLEKGEYPPQETRGFNEAKGITVSQRNKEQAQDYRYFPEPDIPPIVHTQEQLDAIRQEIPELAEDKLQRFIKTYEIRYEDAFLLTRSQQTAQFYERAITELTKGTKQTKQKKRAQTVANLIINKKVSTDQPLKEFLAKVQERSKPKETDTTVLTQAVEHVCTEHTQVVEQIRGGKNSAIMFLVGQVMKQMRGQADAQVVKKALEKHIMV